MKTIAHRCLSVLTAGAIVSLFAFTGERAPVYAASDPAILQAIPPNQCTIQHSVVNLQLPAKAAPVAVSVGTAVCSITPAQRAALGPQAASSTQVSAVAPLAQASSCPSQPHPGNYRYTDSLPTSWSSSYLTIRDEAYYPGSANSNDWAQWCWSYYYPALGISGSLWTTVQGPYCNSGSCVAVSWVDLSPVNVLYYTQVDFVFNGPGITDHRAGPDSPR